MNVASSKKNTSSHRSFFEVFPNPTTSEHDSSLFFIKVFVAAVSHLTYIRGIFPDYLYKSKYVEDIKLKILSGTDLYPSANELIHQMEGIFDAFNRKYLEQAVLGFHTVNDDIVPVEAYTFKFSYVDTEREHLSCSLHHKSEGDQGDTPLALSDKHIADTTVHLLKQIFIATNAMEPLPQKVVIRWKLLYFDKVTPKDYEPPGFMRTTALSVPVIPGNNVGKIVSPFHQIGCDITDDKYEKRFHDAYVSESVVTDDSWPISF